MNEKIDGYQVWKRVDILRKNIALSEICKETGINYASLKANRSDNRLPNIRDSYKLAKYFGCSIEYLLTGKIDWLTCEAEFVITNKSARLLIRRIMDDPRLLDALAAVAALSDKPDVASSKQA